MRSQSSSNGKRSSIRRRFAVFDDYWTRRDEDTVMEELDLFFYSRYPMFKKKR